MLLNISQIRTHILTQGRVYIHTSTTADYIAHWESGGKFPPIQVIQEGEIYWLADGYHRYESLKKAELEIPVDDRQLEATIAPGTLEDAIAIACGANADHGLRRTNDDKVRQLIIYYATSLEWAKQSNRTAAKTCNVSHAFVNDWSKKLRSANRFELFQDTKLDLQTIDKAQEHLTIAAGLPIAATRAGEPLTVQRAPQPTENPSQTPFTYIYLSTTGQIPRGTLCSKIDDSFTDPSLCSIVANNQNLVVPSADLETLPHAIGDRLWSLSEEVEVTVTGFRIVGTIPAVKIETIDDNGFPLVGSQEHFSRIPKQKLVEQTTPPAPQNHVPNLAYPDVKPKLKLVEPIVNFSIYNYTGKTLGFLAKGAEVRILGKPNDDDTVVYIAPIDRLDDKVEVNLKTLEIKQELPSIDLKLLTIADLNFLTSQIVREIRRQSANT